MTSVATSPDPGALALELFLRHRGAVRAYLRLVTGNADVADELAQDVYVRVVQRGTQYEPRGRDRAWLFSIAARLAIDQIRRRKLQPMPLTGRDKDDEEYSIDVEDTGPRPDEVAARRQEERRTRAEADPR